MAGINGTTGDDVLFGTTDDDTINAGAGKDEVRGGDGVDTIYGEDGNDRLFGDAGDDFVFGGEGNDTLIGDAGNDQLFGGNGNDGFFGGGGHDIIKGENGNDNIFGDGGDDLIFGGADDDQLNGGSGNDTLDGGTGTNILRGNTGNDTLIHNFMTSTTTADGGSGFDTLHLEFGVGDLSAAVRSDLALLDQFFTDNLEAAGGDVNVLAGQTSGPELVLSSLGVTLSNVESVEITVDGVGTPLEFFLNQAPEAEAEVALQTNEDVSVSGQVGATDADGDVLAYTVSEGPANGSLVLDEETGDYTYTPSENFSGEDAFNVVVTDPSGTTATQRVTVRTESVADQPVLTVAQATVATGAAIVVGNDFSNLLFGGGEATVTSELDIAGALVDSDGSETLSYTIGNLPDGATLSAGVVNSDGTVTLTSEELEGLTVTAQTEEDFELSVTATSTEENGSVAETTTTVSVEVDPVVADNDVFQALGGNDWIFAGNGDDVVYDGAGNDVAFGGNGNDTFVDGTGSDTFLGGSGFDTLDYSQAENAVSVDMQTGRASGNGSDRFTQIEEVVGSDLGDSLKGSNGDNTINGGAGNDTIVGGGGSDTLTGGAGEDTFSWSRSDTGNKNYFDVITDFDVAEDTLDLSSFGRGRRDANVELTETDEGTVVSVQIGNSKNYREIALLEDVFGVDADVDAGNDWIIV